MLRTLSFVLSADDERNHRPSLMREALYETQLTQAGASEVRLADRPIRAVAGRCVHGYSPFVLLVDEQVSLPAPGSPQGVIRCSEQSAPNTATGVAGVNEEKKHLAVFGMDRCVADDVLGSSTATRNTFGAMCSATS